MTINNTFTLCILLSLFTGLMPAKAQQKEGVIYIKITDQKKEPVFGVYVVHKEQSLLLSATDIDGECSINKSRFNPADSLQFQGMGYEVVSRCIRDLEDSTIISLKELELELQEATVYGVSTEELLKTASSKLKKTRARRIPICYYYSPARYEKITWCRDSAIEYRREYGYHFYSGDIIPKSIWDETYRSYLFRSTLPGVTA